MIEWNVEQITVAKELIAKRLNKYEFITQYNELFTKEFDDAATKNVINMFLCIGMNCSGQTITANNAFTFVKKGINRFFLSLKNRRDLSAQMFKDNEFVGKYNISCDYYVGPAVYYSDIISDDILELWNKWMKPLRIKGRYGVQVQIEKEDGKSDDHIKYRWVTRYKK